MCSARNRVTRDSSQTMPARKPRLMVSQICLALGGGSVARPTIGSIVSGVCGVYAPSRCSRPARLICRANHVQS